MSKKRKRRKGGSNPAPAGQIAETLGLDDTVWDVGVSYNKGFLTNSRYRHVRVTHRPSGKTEERGFYANNKADARRPPARTLKELVKRMTA